MMFLCVFILFCRFQKKSIQNPSSSKLRTTSNKKLKKEWLEPSRKGSSASLKQVARAQVQSGSSAFARAGTVKSAEPDMERYKSNSNSILELLGYTKSTRVALKLYKYTLKLSKKKKKTGGEESKASKKGFS
jgi:hypothetical protein